MGKGWQYYVMRVLSAVVCLFSYERIIAWGRKLGPWGEKLLKKQRQRGLLQVRESLHCSTEEAERIIAEMFANLGQSLLEIMYTPRLQSENISSFVTLEHQERLEEALQADKGVIVLTGHFGNWEWLGASLALYGYPTTTIVKNQPNDQVTRFLNEYRIQKGLEVFPRGGNAMIIAARALKRKKILGFLADQDGGKEGIPCTFFGKIASSPKGAAQFSYKFGSPVIPVFAVHDANHHHRVVVGEAVTCPFCGDPRKDIAALTAAITAVTETWIRTYPSEWLWFQHRWNTPPEEMTALQAHKGDETCVEKDR